MGSAIRCDLFLGALLTYLIPNNFTNFLQLYASTTPSSQSLSHGSLDIKLRDLQGISQGDATIRF